MECVPCLMGPSMLQEWKFVPGNAGLLRHTGTCVWLIEELKND